MEEWTECEACLGVVEILPPEHADLQCRCGEQDPEHYDNDEEEGGYADASIVGPEYFSLDNY